MKHLICSILLALTAHTLSAQSLSPEVVASAGESFSSSTINLDWTLGELMIESESYAGSLILTQGFHQPSLQTTSIDDLASSLGAIKVYPNPTAGLLSIEKEKTGELQMAVLDIQGRIVLNTQTSATFSQLDLSHLPSGMYILRMSDGKNTTRSIRIRKM